MRIGTCLAYRGLEACEIMHDQHKPFWFETPKRRPGKPSLFKLPRAIAVAGRDGVTIVAFVQCPLGAPTTKPTELLSYLLHTDPLPKDRTHQPRWWATPWSGEALFGPHPVLKGRQLMIPWDIGVQVCDGGRSRRAHM